MKQSSLYSIRGLDKVLFWGVLFSILWLWGCSTDQLAGTGSSTGNAKVSGVIRDNNGLPVSQTIVCLIPKAFNAVKDSVVPASLVDTTDEQGKYRFAIVGTGDYNLYARNPASSKQLFSEGIKVQDTGAIQRIDTLVITGVIRLIFQDTLLISSGYVIIPGSMISARIGSTVSKQGNQYVGLINGVFPFVFDGLYYVKNKYQESPLRLTGEFEVTSGDTTTVHCLKVSTTLNMSNSELPENRIFAISVDNSDNSIWFGSYLGYIAHLKDEQWYTYNISDMGVVSSILWIAVDSSGSKWFGLSGGVLEYKNSSFKLYDFNVIFGGHVRKVYQVCVDRNNVKWFGTFGAGLVRYDNVSWKKFTLSNTGMPCDSINSLAIEKNGTLWMGTNRGLFRYDLKNWSCLTRQNSFIPSDTIRAIAVDDKDVKWIASYGAVSSLDMYNRWTTYSSCTSILPRDTIHSIATDLSGNVWCGTQKGVFQFDGKNWTMFNYLNSHLPQNPGKIYCIVVDSYNNKWISTESGGVVVFGMFPMMFPK
jgi:hypothetical protein